MGLAPLGSCLTIWRLDLFSSGSSLRTTYQILVRQVAPVGEGEIMHLLAEGVDQEAISSLAIIILVSSILCVAAGKMLQLAKCSWVEGTRGPCQYDSDPCDVERKECKKSLYDASNFLL
ncbi:hypothetical protein DUI87_06466 [Hirundo rustica rustica]|uniref:Uncharacterized protein n=1 Tax=Hirundo rustica rustica TaxID=333673 RepID=A0A3M0KTA6_HIRRU|nr:hypothetical protein DUI87_06466 [Hirundo rustica rustica]